MSAESTPEKLLSPFALRDLELPNRVVLAPLTRARAGEQRLANALMAECISGVGQGMFCISLYLHALRNSSSNCLWPLGS